MLGVGICLLLVMAVVATPAAAEESKAPHKDAVERLEIVDRAIEFHGGELFLWSNSELLVSSKSGSFKVRSTMSGSRFDHQVESQTEEGKRIVVRSRNDSVERREDGVVVPLNDEQEQRARDFVSARTYFPFLPFRLNDADAYKIDQGIETWGNRSLHRVKVVFAAGSSTDASDEYVYFFDPKTARLEAYGYTFGTGRERGGLRYRKLFNYRRVEGLLFFDAENLGVSGEGSFTVDSLNEKFVETLEPVSTIELSEIEVESLL